MATSKICKVCGETKDKADFRERTRMCKPCQDEHKKIYMTKYYEENRKRLIKINSDAYHAKNPIKKKMGRPRVHVSSFENDNLCSENILSC